MARDKVRQQKYNEQYRADHKDDAAASWKTYYEANKEPLKARQKEKYRANPALYLFYAARARAKKFGLEFNIEPSDIVIPDVCPVFKTPFEVGDRNRCPSVDRKHPDKGYVKGNVAVISFRANRLKNNASVEEIEAILDWMES